ncbi:MAG TPA: peptide synthase [Desulfobulbus sp.]|nr:peptide synthase [Desulfobulbus sp.]
MTDYNIANVLEQTAGEQGARTGLVAPAGGRWPSWSFAGLWRNTCRFAGILARQGICPGDRVLLMVRPSMEFICLTFALFRLGAVVILIDPGMGTRNLLRCIGRVRPRFLVGIGRALLLSRLVPGPFASLRRRIPVRTLSRALENGVPGSDQAPQPWQAGRDEPAAIIFTTGSTGPPKGVQYTHGIFSAQLGLIRDYFGIGGNDVDQPGFPLFGLFSIVLGARVVIPDMDPTRPARVDPGKFIRSILDQEVTFSFGSPAIWNVVSRYCLERGMILPLRQVLMAGAPVSGELVERVRDILPPDATIHTPYGATECLPVAAITGGEILAQTWPLSLRGLGICVGRPLPGMEIRVIEPVDGAIGSWSEVTVLETGQIGEIVVRGPVVTRKYDHDPEQTRLAKIPDNDTLWHRMGDMGYLDKEGRLWFCGRKAHRVLTAEGPLDTIPVETIFNTHPRVFRSALVGVGPACCQRPVLVVEPAGRIGDRKKFLQELREIAGSHAVTRPVQTFLVHKSFPVDIRHNAKIFREKLAVWAERRLRARRCVRNKDGL